MVFSSAVFLFLFLPAVLLIYYNPWVKTRSFRNVFLLLASLGFYAWGEPVFVFLMIFSIIITWCLGLGIDANRARAKTFLTIGIIYHVGVLFIFKYLGFMSQQLGILLHKPSMGMDIALPIGISFFTFQLMSYLFDVYYQKAEVQKNLLYVGLYISLFPQLIAGPIVRYNQIAAEINTRQENVSNIVWGTERFIYGLGKKMLLANYLAYTADSIFDAGSRSVAMAWLGAVAYTLQIYFDFSGYSDMAIGLGRMFGFHFSENFNYPYISSSVTEFWRRWHISLSAWFRDYVYIPLGGNRVSKKRWVWNLFIVWLLTGLWHGANWTFLCWGLLYFLVLLFERLAGFPRQQGVFAHGYTMLIVGIAWVIFRAETLAQGICFIGNMFGVGSNGWTDGAFLEMMKESAVVLAVAMILSAPIYRQMRKWIMQKSEAVERIVRSGICLAVFVLSILQVVASSYSPFIYFNF